MSKFLKLAFAYWIQQQKYSNRIESLHQEEKEKYLKNFSNTPIFKEINSILEKKYLNSKNSIV